MFVSKKAKTQRPSHPYWSSPTYQTHSYKAKQHYPTHDHVTYLQTPFLQSKAKPSQAFKHPHTHEFMTCLNIQFSKQSNDWLSFQAKLTYPKYYIADAEHYCFFFFLTLCSFFVLYNLFPLLSFFLTFISSSSSLSLCPCTFVLFDSHPQPCMHI